MAKSSTYKFTQKATDKLIAMGYVFFGINEIDFKPFMQKYFPGLNLVAWLQAVEKLTIPHAGTRIWRGIEVNGDMLHVRFENDFTSEDDALVFDRKLYRDTEGMKISHEYFVLPSTAREKDISKKVLKLSLVHYQKMKADHIEVIAGLSKGAYVWARHGFVATDREDIKRIMKQAKTVLTPEQYEFIEAIYDSYYHKNPSGVDFPIKNWADLPFMKDVLMNPVCEWKGRLDLNNSEQLRKFEEYVSRQKK
jgi:hypothetical protein